MASILVSTRVPGRHSPTTPDWRVPLPPARTDSEPLTVRALITRVVQEELAAFRSRQREARLRWILSERKILTDAAQGRVRPGPSAPAPRASTSISDESDQAVANALQAFEDGLYLVLLDGRELRRLDEVVQVQPESVLTFLRLTFLAGA